jgi:aspartate carbamoyltransferase catalytic subunit
VNHLLGIEGSSQQEVAEILQEAFSFARIGTRPIPKVPALRGRTVATLFFEPSTRTRLSFEAAARRLSADTMSFQVASSSLAKGESLKDTVLTVVAMGADLLVVRHSSAGVAHQVARWVELAKRPVGVVNAGDGCHEHPTQALLDLATLQQHFGSVSGLVVLIVGDVRHSRVARSLVWALSLAGASVLLAGPPTLLPVSLEGWPIEGVHFELDSILGEVDVVYLLRLQEERMQEATIASLHEYTRLWQLDSRRLREMKPDSVVMHPGPMNRGVEIAPEVADSTRALVADQVSMGVAVRTAVLYLLGLSLGGRDPRAGDVQVGDLETSELQAAHGRPPAPGAPRGEAWR